MTRRSPSDAGTADGSHSRLENGRTLNRITFRATDEQLAALESLVEADVYHSRSAAIRAGIQQLLESQGSPDRNRDRS